MLLGLAPSGALAQAPSPSPGVDLGSRTHGLAGAPAVQPSPAPVIRLDPRGNPVDPGNDTPGKTGLGNLDRNPVGGADKGPGVEPGEGTSP
jgi:hypothetical protein